MIAASLWNRLVSRLSPEHHRIRAAVRDVDRAINRYFLEYDLHKDYASLSDRSMTQEQAERHIEAIRWQWAECERAYKELEAAQLKLARLDADAAAARLRRHL